MIQFTLSWPSKLLGRNSTAHWATKAKAIKAYRREAGWKLIKAADANVLHVMRSNARIQLHYVFCPPGRYRYDDDELEARMKAGRDGIADVLDIDDHQFTATRAMGEVGKPGKVKVTITGGV